MPGHVLGFLYLLSASTPVDVGTCCDVYTYIYIYVCMYIYVFDRIELHHVKKYLNVAVSSTFTAHHVYIMVCLFG